MLYVIIFLVMFRIGGSSGIVLSNGCMDLVLHDSYYVVSHFHVVLSLGSVISLLCGLVCYWKIILVSHVLWLSLVHYNSCVV